MAQSCSNDSAISYVLPVLWMTSCFHMTGHVVYGEALRPRDDSQREETQVDGASAFQLLPALRSIPLRDIRRP